MKTRGWLVVLMGFALIAFGAHPCLASQSTSASVQRHSEVVPVGYKAPGPDSNWVEVPSGNSDSATVSAGTDSGGVEVDNEGSAISGKRQRV